MEERTFIVDKGLWLVHQSLVLGPVLYNTVMNKLQHGIILFTHTMKLLRAIMAGKVCAEHSGM